jgi:hypothetical protein
VLEKLRPEKVRDLNLSIIHIGIRNRDIRDSQSVGTFKTSLVKDKADGERKIIGSVEELLQERKKKW